MFDTLIKNGLVVLRDEVKRLDLGLHDGRIAAIGTELGEAARTIDAQGSYVLPGMVDVHMHISEPGRTEWEGYRTGTRAMAAGGTTSFVKMPLNTPPATTDLAALEIKLAAARGQCYVDYAAMAGLVPWNLADLEPLSAAGVAAYKCFVATCGSDEPGDFRNVDDYQLYLGMQTLARTGDLLVVHCENAAATSSCTRSNGAPRVPPAWSE